MESSRSFSVQSKVLCKRLCNAEFKALFDEIPDSPSIVLEISRRKTLVCTVKEREMLPCSYNLGNFLPLLSCGIDAGRIVGASVKENDTTFGSLLDCGTQAIVI